MKRLSESGGASIISVGFIAILILILTISITRLMTGELRHAIDLENNIEAYYEAEGGIEEAILALRQLIAANPGSSTALLAANVQQNCDKTGGADGVLNNFGAPGGTGFIANNNITCRRVRTASSFIDSTLNVGDTAHYDLSQKQFSYIELQWDNQDLTSESPATSFVDLQQAAPAPPFLEITRIDYDNTGAPTNIAPSNIKLKSLYLAPIISGSSECLAPNIDFQTCNDVALGGAEGGRVKVRCTTAPVYRCTATIYNFMPTSGPGKRTVLRLRPYFSAMQYTMKIVDGIGKPVDVALDRTIIDVTARVGSSYRRIEQEVSLVPKPVDGGEAVFGDDRVCKEFTLFNTISGEGLIPSSVPPECRLD